MEPLADEVARPAKRMPKTICHVAFDQPPLSRHESAEGVKKPTSPPVPGYAARQVLEALLRSTPTGIETHQTSENPAASAIRPHQLRRWSWCNFGGKHQYAQALAELESQLYA